MRHSIAVIAVLIGLAAACGGDAKEKAATPGTGAATIRAAASTDGAAPVQFTFLGLTDDKSEMRYSIKVLSDREIDQVDLGVRYLDSAGKALGEERLLWQNIVGSKREPIRSGQTYEDHSYAYPGTTNIEAKLLRVVFKDGSAWDAPGR
jgi:hypothetical protein